MRQPVRIFKTPSNRSWWSWPWLHWCMFDRDCRFWGVPARVHVWPLRLVIEINDEPLPLPDWPGIRPRPLDPMAGSSPPPTWPPQ